MAGFLSVFSRNVGLSAGSLAFPHYCPACGEEWLSGEGYICPECWSKLPAPSRGLWYLDEMLRYRVSVAFKYDMLTREIVHHMKFYNRTDIAPKLGFYAAERLKSRLKSFVNPTVVPIPLHPVRTRERGYDQILYIARGFAERLGWRIEPNLIRRVRNTRPQSQLSDNERLVNLIDAFAPVEESRLPIENKVVLIDDVIHTGATARGCVEVLSRMGVEDVVVVAVCG